MMTVYQHAVLTDDIAGLMSGSLGDYVAGFKAEILAKESRLIEFDTGCGSYFAILRPEGRELVVAALSGAGGSSDTVTDWIYAFASGGGFESVRFHTQRRGLSRLLKKYTPVFSEEVFKIKVA